MKIALCDDSSYDLELLKKSILDKNLKFTHRWIMLNRLRFKTKSEALKCLRRQLIYDRKHKSEDLFKYTLRGGVKRV